jgi:hypothetical protein
MAGLKRHQRFACGGLTFPFKSGSPMPPPAAKSRRDRGVAPTPLIDLLTSGKSIDQIAEIHNHTRGRTESLLRKELKAMSIRPAKDYAKLQIRRLEAIVDKLTEKANKGELAAIDRVLRILARLDNYHGFTKAPVNARRPAEPDVDERDDEAFDRKLADLLVLSEKAQERRDGETTRSDGGA